MTLVPTMTRLLLIQTGLCLRKRGRQSKIPENTCLALGDGELPAH